MFVDRTDGVVTGVYNVAQREGQEELPADHPDLVAFLRSLGGGQPAPLTDEEKLERIGLTVAGLKRLLA